MPIQLYILFVIGVLQNELSTTTRRRDRRSNAGCLLVCFCFSVKKSFPAALPGGQANRGLGYAVMVDRNILVLSRLNPARGGREGAHCCTLVCVFLCADMAADGRTGIVPIGSGHRSEARGFDAALHPLDDHGWLRAIPSV